MDSENRNRYWNKLTLDLLAHLIVTLSLACIFFAKGNSLMAVFCCFVGGILIDLDHLLDYFSWYGNKFNIKDFLGSRYFAESGKLYLPFHSWELIIMLWVGAFATGLGWIYALSSSMTAHMVIDHAIHKKKPLYYSLVNRWIKGFDHNRLDPNFKKFREEFF